MLDVLLHGRHIGTIVREPKTSILSFVLAEDYLEDEARLILGQQFEDRRGHLSLAGVQLKFSAVREPGDRFTLPFQGRNGDWILKFGSAQFPKLPENEFATMQWASRSGLDVPRHELVPVRSIAGLDPRFFDLGENVFVIERYDRLPDGARIHQEDFAQVRGILPEHKYAGASYEGLARFVGDLCGHDDLLEFIRRVVFNILCGNSDAHLKNWSLIYPDGRTARLAPAYDMVFVRYYLSNNPDRTEAIVPNDRGAKARSSCCLDPAVLTYLIPPCRQLTPP